MTTLSNPASNMGMPVVNVREVGMLVLQRGVLVHMGMRLRSIPLEVVRVLVVGVMTMAVFMHRLRVGMVMRMDLAEV